MQAISKHLEDALEAAALARESRIRARARLFA